MFNSLSNFFPFYALPPGIRDAVEEVQRNIQAPIEIAVASAMGAISLACQDQVNVRRPNGLEGPCSLFLITVAGSGDRKTSCDKLFTKPIRDLERQSEHAAEIAKIRFESDLAEWSIQTSALKHKLLQLKKKEK